jgi:hypothetical protein
VLLEDLAPPLGRTQPAAIEVGEHPLGRSAERDAFDSADLGKPDEAECQVFTLAGPLALVLFLALTIFFTRFRIP